MASDGYVVVKSRVSGWWYTGSKDGCQALWSKERPDAKRFESQAEFRQYFQRTFGVSYKASWGHFGCARFVRIHPRKEAA